MKIIYLQFCDGVSDVCCCLPTLVGKLHIVVKEAPAAEEKEER